MIDPHQGVCAISNKSTRDQHARSQSLLEGIISLVERQNGLSTIILSAEIDLFASQLTI